MKKDMVLQLTALFAVWAAIISCFPNVKRSANDILNDMIADLEKML